MPISKAIFASKSPLIANVRELLRLDGRALRTEQAYVCWIVDFIFYHGAKTHPREYGDAEVTAYLSSLANGRNLSRSSQNQAFNALLYLFNRVLEKPFGQIKAERSKRKVNAPVILSKDELLRLFATLDEPWRLIARLAYGCGLRLMEVLRLRVKDMDFDNRIVTVRSGKGDKDRMVPMPNSLHTALKDQSQVVALTHQADLKNGFGCVWLPDALDRKYPNAAKELQWQWLFPSKQICTDPRTGDKRRHHLFPTAFQSAMKLAAKKAGIHKRVSPHVLRHSGATHMLEMGKSIMEVKEWLGHQDVRTTMIYLHVANLRKGQPTPVDCLCDS